MILDSHADSALAFVQNAPGEISLWMKRSPWVKDRVRPGHQVFVMSEEGASKAIVIAERMRMTCARLRARADLPGAAENCIEAARLAEVVLRSERKRYPWLFDAPQTRGAKLTP